MFLFAANSQDDVPQLNFAELRRGWHHDFLGFLRGDLPSLVFLFIYTFILLRIVLFFVNRTRKIADRLRVTGDHKRGPSR